MEQEHDRLKVEVSVARTEAADQIKSVKQELAIERRRGLEEIDVRVAAERASIRRQHEAVQKELVQCQEQVLVSILKCGSGHVVMHFLCMRSMCSMDTVGRREKDEADSGQAAQNHGGEPQ
jgi:hypothetical protein